jgi:hypothetical protein
MKNIQEVRRYEQESGLSAEGVETEGVEPAEREAIQSEQTIETNTGLAPKMRRG